MKKIITALSELLSPDAIKLFEPMKYHTTFQIGGPADIFVQPKSFNQLKQIIKLCLLFKTPYFVIGKGSDLLVSDDGIRGVVISTNKLKKYKILSQCNRCSLDSEERLLIAETGALLTELSNYALENGLTGLEFACGIPGSVGGAIYMNAGAYESEIKDILAYSIAVNTNMLQKVDNSVPIPEITLTNADHKFSYRYSIFQEQSFILHKAAFKLKLDEPQKIKARMQTFTAMRKEKQPLDLPSAGSVFKRPQGYFTGKLIDDCGLRGYRIGDAAVSDKHCGFIVNLGKASAQDVLALIKYIQLMVKEKFGVDLQPEIKLIGFTYETLQISTP